LAANPEGVCDDSTARNQSPDRENVVFRIAPIVLMAQPGTAVSAALVGQSQLVFLILVVVLVVAIALVSNATGVIWALVSELLAGLWAGVKAIALMLIILVCLLYLLAHGGVGPG
jgi:hypothetical protein